MHLLLPLAAALTSLSVMGQTDDGQHPPRLPGSGNMGQIKMEDDKDPFKPNAFVGSFRMEMHFFQQGTEDPNGPANMQYWSSTDMSLVGMTPERSNGTAGTDLKLLTDHKGKWSYILMTDPKGNKTAMKSPKKKYILADDGRQELAAKIQVTKETKVIDGHTCTKVIATLEEGTWTGWVTKDIAVPFSDIAGTMSRNALARGSGNWDGIPGFPLEYEMADTEGRKTIHAYVRDLHVGEVDPQVFSISGYKVMEVPGMQ